MQSLRIFPALLLILFLAACTQKESSQASSADSNSPRATILMRDGTTVTGAVTSTTPSQITLLTDSGSTRTILTKDVTSVQYGEATAGNQVATAPTNAARNSTKPVEETRNKPEPAPQLRYHPDRSAIQTKTFQIPAG